MDTHELLEEATRRQIVALGEVPVKGRAPIHAREGTEAALDYIAVMGIEDEEAFKEWVEAQVLGILFSIGVAQVMHDLVGTMMSGFVAGLSCGYQLALIREETSE